ncbi:MAG: hypothetical protein KDD44_05865 [Bdellovibrionales bacterium]|nr:hypothetical protein [Bdellovibrionales bacterium]
MSSLLEAGLVIGAIVTLSVLLNYRARRCPSCGKLRWFGASSGESYISKRDDTGAPIEIVVPYRCRACNDPYVVIWNDFEGTRTLAHADAPPPVERSRERG